MCNKICNHAELLRHIAIKMRLGEVVDKTKLL